MNVTSRRWRPLCLFLVVISCVGCDQATKRYAIANLQGQPAITYFGDTLIVKFAKNEGAFLGLGNRLPQRARFWIFTVANGAMMLFVAGYLLTAKTIGRLSVIALALIVAGGVGNLIDRVLWDGNVIDFLILDSGIGPLRTGVFNVADMAITAGFFLLLPQLFRGDSKQNAPQPEPAT